MYKLESGLKTAYVTFPCTCCPQGKAYHKMKQQCGKPLENPFIGYVFSEDLGLNVHVGG